MNDRNNEIDFFRFVFAILVMGSHAYALLGWNHCLSGAIGVEFFFVVSGYFFARSLKKTASTQGAASLQTIGSDSVRFIFRKIGTFYPYFLFSFVIAFIVNQITPGNQLLLIFKNGIRSIWELLLMQTAGYYGYWPVGTAWYLSALILAQWLLYPLARKNYNLYVHWFAPLAVILINGVFSRTCENIHGTTDLLFGFASHGILRAINEICLGSIAFEVANWLGGFSLKKLARVLLTIVEIGGYGVMLVNGWFFPVSQFDYLILLLIAISIAITMSGQGLIGPLFRGKLPLGKLSLVLYLNHFYWALAIRTWLPNLSTAAKVGLFFGVSFVTAIICLVVVDAIKKSFKPEAWKRRLIQEKPAQ